jgi:hypothetical protein
MDRSDEEDYNPRFGIFDDMSDEEDDDNLAQSRITEWINNNNVNATLYLDDLNLRELPTLPPNLQKLDCTDNQLTSLPELPNNLIQLSCGTNQITTLPILPNTLKYLYCSDNQLTNLPSLPNSLQELYCNTNVLTSLPDLPNSLIQLLCENNLLTTLPNLPNNLIKLHCYNNELTNLPELPNSLIELYCYNNELTNLPDLPNSLRVLDIHNINLLTPTQIQFLNNNDVAVYIYGKRINLIPHLPEPTEEELNNRRILGENRYNQVTNDQLLRNANFIDNLQQNVDDIPLYLNELDSKTQDVYKSKCNNKEDITGDTLNVKYGNIVILDISNPRKYVAWCFTYPEALLMWQFHKVYSVLPLTGQIINQRGILLSRLYNTFVLRNTNTRTVNYDGHHDEKPIYTLDPIPQNAFVNEIRITPQIINNFVPTINDLNLYYLNNPYTQPNNNNVIINNDSIIGNLGEITLNNPIRNVVTIIKDKDGGDINKSYDIIGDNVVLIQNVIVGDNVELIQDELLGEY